MIDYVPHVDICFIKRRGRQIKHIFEAGTVACKRGRAPDRTHPSSAFGVRARGGMWLVSEGARMVA